MSDSSYTLPSVNIVDPKEEKKSNRPKSSKFYQQKLPAWEPIHTVRSVVPILLVLSVYFIVIGVVLLLESNDMIEVSKDYTECQSINDQFCKDFRLNMSDMTQPCSCVVEVDIPTDMKGEVMVYYGLTNFYQNHKFYLKSRDDQQLNGKHKTAKSISSECASYSTIQDENNESIPIAPCGAIANSYFNDSFNIEDSRGTQISILQTGIAWPTDSGDKFNNPEPRDNLTEAFSDYAQPLFWNKRVEQLDSSNPDNNGYLNEPFEVWMRCAAFSTFRKAYGRIVNGLPKGKYNITVDYNFPTTAYSGTKRIIFTTKKWIGFKNQFLGIAHLVTGGVTILLCLILFFVHLKAKI